MKSALALALLAEREDRRCVGVDGHRLSYFAGVRVDHHNLVFTDTGGDLW